MQKGIISEGGKLRSRSKEMFRKKYAQ